MRAVPVPQTIMAAAMIRCPGSLSNKGPPIAVHQAKKKGTGSANRFG